MKKIYTQKKTCVRNVHAHWKAVLGKWYKMLDYKRNLHIKRKFNLWREYAHEEDGKETTGITDIQINRKTNT